MRSTSKLLSGRLVLLLCCAAAVFEGYDLQAPGVTLPDIAPMFGLTRAAGSSFLSISTFGLLLGALIGGPSSDRLGRRLVLVVSVATFGLLSLATSAATSLQGLMVTRFLTGVGLGGALPNLIAIVAETTPLARRRGTIGILYASLPFGGAVASLVSALIGRPADWPLVYAVGGVVPIGLAVLLAVCLPPFKPAAAEVTPTGRRPSLWGALFGAGRTADTLLLWTAFFFALVVMYLLLGWLPSLLVARGLGKSAASGVQVSFNLASAAASIGMGRLLDGRHRRRLIVLAYAAAALSLAALALAPAQVLILLLAGALVGACVSAVQTIVYGSAPGCYPLEVRGAGVGAAVAFGRLGSAMGPLIGGLAITAKGSPGQTLEVLLPAVLLSGAASWLLDRRRSDLTSS